MKTINPPQAHKDRHTVLSVVVSYNFMRWIDKCLPSLLQSEEPTDVLVIDNASTDDTVAVIRERYPQVRLIANTENLGFGRANNIGMRLALDEGYDGVFLINQDAWIKPDTLGKLINASIEHPEYGIISPLHLTGDGSKLDAGFAAYIGKKEAVASCGLCPAPFINAALWYIPSPVIREVGMFAPLFYHYGEDKDYANRIRYHGYRIGYVPQAIGYHDRAERPFTRQLSVRTESVYHLSEYANVNYSFATAFAYGALAPIKKAARSFAKGKWRDGADYIAMSIKLLVQTAEICKTRKQAKQ